MGPQLAGNCLCRQLSRLFLSWPPSLALQEWQECHQLHNLEAQLCESPLKARCLLSLETVPRDHRAF